MASPKQPRGWGQNIEDFKMKVNSHGYKQTRQQSKGPSQRIKPAGRKISKELDYFHGFTRRTFWYDDFEAEISDDQAIPTSSTNQDFPDDSDIVISEDDEDTGDFNERANPNWNGDEFQGINLTLTEDVVDKYTMFFAEVGDAPTLSAYPIDIQKQILNHDRHYEKIVHRIFDKASQYTHKSLEKSPFTVPFWKWLQANQDKDSRDKILGILLHPHTRSFKVRAAIGKRDWKNLSAELQMKPLDREVPDVLGTYHLEGERRCGATTLEKNGRYCGRGIRYNSGHDLWQESCGVRARLLTYLLIIEAAQKKRGQAETTSKVPTQEQDKAELPNTLNVYERLTHEDIERVRYCLLSVFPPVLETRQEKIHFHCLLNLAESVDIVLPDTMSDTAPPQYGGQFALHIRPTDMPKGDFEGLNRALPTRQDLKISIRQNWEPKEVLTFIEVFANHQAEIYGSSLQWDVVAEKLRQRGIEKPRQYLHSLYHELISVHDESIESYRSWRFKQRWQFIWRFKTFLEENHFITPPEEHEETDLYYRIPGLEAGSLTFHQLALFLHQHQFVLNGDDMSDGTICPVDRTWLIRFGSLVLPHMLLREVWDKIEESPPGFIHLKGSRRSHYLVNRIRDVVLYYIHKEGNKKRPMPTESQNLVDQHHIMDWPFFLEVYLESLTRLTTDGVPRDRIFPRGLYNVLMIWGQWSRLQPLRSLPQWTYDPSKDSIDLRKGDDSARLTQQGNTSAEPSESYQDDQPVLKDDENCNNEESAYVWPSDTRRYEVFAYRRPPQSQNTALDGRTSKRQRLLIRTEKALSTMRQHKVSSLRILAALARDVHHQGFIDDNYTEQQFWEHLWYRLNELRWSIASNVTLKKRFSWVLDWVREGEMPLEPLSFLDALLQVWYGAEGALESATHPYNIPPGCGFSRELINPDLDPRWVKGILAHGDSAQKVRSRLLKYHKLDISHDDIGNKYGILLPYVWEKAYAQGYLNSRGDLFQPEQTHEDTTPVEPDELDGISDSASQSEAEEVGKAPAKPVTQAEAAKLEAAVMEMIRDDYQSQNGSTWMWLHLQRTHILGQRGNGVLLEKILDLDPDFACKEKRICMKLRKELGIVDYAEEEEFSWHGRRLPPGLVTARRLRLPWPDNTRSSLWFLNTDKLKDESGCFIYFNKDGVDFRGANGVLLLRYPKHELVAMRLNHYKHELNLQLAKAQGKPKPAKRTAAPQRKPGMEFTLEELEWLLARVPPGDMRKNGVRINDVAAEFAVRFQYERSIGSIIGILNKSRGPKIAEDTWTLEQRRWIVLRANDGIPWSEMAERFKDKFDPARTAEELEDEYESIRDFKDQSPGVQPKWLALLPHLKGTPKDPGNRTRWTKEQEDWIVARLSTQEADGDRRLMDIEDRQLAAEFKAKFNVVRTVKSIIHKKAKLARAHTEIKIQKKPKRYTKEEKSFIIKYKQAGNTLEQVITDFQQKFGSEHMNDGLKVKWYRFTNEQSGRTTISRKGQSKKSASSVSATNEIPVNKESTSTRGTRKRERAAAGGNEQSDAGNPQDNAEAARPSDQTMQNATANEQARRSTRSRQVKKDSADAGPTAPRQSK